MIVNIALLTVTDTRTFENDKSGAILVKKIEEAKHKLIDRKICKDTKEEIVKMAEDIIYMMYIPPAIQNVANHGNKFNEEIKAESHEKLVG